MKKYANVVWASPVEGPWKQNYYSDSFWDNTPKPPPSRALSPSVELCAIRLWAACSRELATSETWVEEQQPPSVEAAEWQQPSFLSSFPPISFLQNSLYSTSHNQPHSLSPACSLDRHSEDQWQQRADSTSLCWPAIVHCVKMQLRSDNSDMVSSHASLCDAYEDMINVFNKATVYWDSLCISEFHTHVNL